MSVQHLKPETQSLNLPPFNPGPLIRNPHLQSVVASQAVVPRTALVSAAKEMVLTVPVNDGVRLQGFYSAQPAGQSRGLALMLHGWLGSVESTYMLAVGDALFERSYSVFRLNMRDHGGTEALNEGAFHGCLLEEVFQAARQVTALEPDRPFFVMGFSMGGNFALRVAWRHSQNPIDTLRQVVAVSPSVNPKAAVLASDRHAVYNLYFLRKWQKMMQAKQAAFPHRYNFDGVFELNSSWEIGERVIPMYTGFANSDDYYACYAAGADKLQHLTVPTTIITARDDPIIPIADFTPLLGLNSNLRLMVQPHGGHVGFISRLVPLRRWLVEAIPALLAA